MYKVFTKSNCVYCTQAKALLDKLKIPYETYSLGDSFEGGDGKYTVTIEQMCEMIGKRVRSIPQIMKDDKLKDKIKNYDSKLKHNYYYPISE